MLVLQRRRETDCSSELLLRRFDRAARRDLARIRGMLCRCTSIIVGHSNRLPKTRNRLVNSPAPVCARVEPDH